MDSRVLRKCRLCLEFLDTTQTFELFAESKKTQQKPNSEDNNYYNPIEDELKLCEKVEYCCGVRIRKSTEMPTKICLKCFDITRIWFKFRQMCINSQVYLESLCSDRQKPKDLQDKDESAYLDYLLEDLQTIRINIVNSTSEGQAALANDSQELEHGDDNIDQYNQEALLKGESNFDESEFEYQEQSMNENEDGSIEMEDVDYRIPTPDLKVISEKTRIRKSKAATPATLSPNSQKKSINSFMCSVCGNVYTKKSSFTYHMTLHSDKPHDCEICGKVFRQVSELKNHMRRHTGEKPYKCSYCDRCFIDRSERHRHERGAHSNSRPYACTVCGKSFAYSAILKNHSKLHSGQKDFNCLVCDKSFSLKHHLKAHLQTLIHKHKASQFIAEGYEVIHE